MDGQDSTASPTFPAALGHGSATSMPPQQQTMDHHQQDIDQSFQHQQTSFQHDFCTPLRNHQSADKQSQDQDQGFGAADGQELAELAAVAAVTTPTKGVFCAQCRLKINDRFYLVADGKSWHNQCLRCNECFRQLDTNLPCFAKQSSIYCKYDYYR